MWDISTEETDDNTSRAYSCLSNASPISRKEASSRYGSQNSISANLQKSLLLLNDGALPQGPKKVSSSKKTPRMTSYSRSSMMNVTDISLNATEYTSKYDQTIDQSAVSSIHQLMEQDPVDITVASAALLAEEDPGIEASSGLFTKFFTALKESPSYYQVFELIQNFEECCGDQLQLLSKLLKLAPPSEKTFMRTASIKTLLEEEKNTWGLIRSVYQDRIHSKTNPDSDMMMDDFASNVSDQSIIDNFFQNDSSIRQCQLVLDWLERNSAEKNEFDVQMEYFADNNVPWENTLHFLDKKQSQVHFSVKRPIVSEMDPDAPIRQNCPLHDLDKEDDARMYKFVFANIRCGALEKAQEISMKCGQSWLAAALEGWRLTHDPNYTSTSNHLQEMKGNVYRTTWKSVCWKLADDERLSLHERAIYAAFSGNLKVLLNSCFSWDDYLWAYLRSMIDSKVEQVLSESVHHANDDNALPVSYWEKKYNIENIFEEIEASSNLKVRMGASNFYRQMQKYIILDDIDGLIEQMHDYLTQNAAPAKHIIRFMAHLVLFLRTINRSCKEELCLSILKAYVQNLIEDKQLELVAYYVATLPDNQQVFWYSKFLEGIMDHDEQKLCLELAREAELDIEHITKTVVENIRNKDPDDSNSFLQANTTNDDKVKIQSINWLMFDDSHRAEALIQANALMRTFVACKKIDAAKEVISKIPPNSIDFIVRQNFIKFGETELSAENENATREYLCMNAYLNALDSFNEWFKHYNHSKPKEPVLASKSTFPEQVAFEHQKKQYDADLDRWQHSLNMQTEFVKSKMYNVLLFIDGGWMVDCRQDELDNENRSQQLHALRKLCIPQICFLLHSVLNSLGLHKQALQLADIVASEQHKLYEVFSTEELRQFLNKMTDSSLVSLDENLDPLGYILE